MEILSRLRHRFTSKFNLKNLAYISILYLAILLALIFGEVNNCDTTNSFGYSFSWASTFIFFIGILIVYGVAFYIAHVNNIYRFNKRVALFIVIAFIVWIYMTLVPCFTDYSQFDLNGNNFIEPLDIVKSSMDVILMIFMCFSFFFMVPPFKEKDLAIRFYCFLYLGFTIFCIIYSLCTELETYTKFLENPNFITKWEGVNNDISVKSCFYYGNVFGHVLFMACLAVTLLSISYKHRFIFLFVFVFGSFILFSGSRTGFLGFFVLLLSYYVSYLIQMFKARRWRFWFLLAFTLFLTILILFEVFVFKNITFKETLYVGTPDEYTVTYTILDVFQKAFRNMEIRLDLVFIPVLNRGYSITNHIFGIGYNINDLVARHVTDIFNYHNGFVEVYTAGGIFFSLIMILLFVVVILKFKVIKKVDSNYIYFFFICLIPYFVYQFGEAFFPLANVFGGGMMAVYFFMVPMTKSRELTRIVDIKYLFVKKDTPLLIN